MSAYLSLPLLHTLSIHKAKFRFDPAYCCTYVFGVEKGNAGSISLPRAGLLRGLPPPHSLTGSLGRGIFNFLLTLQGLGAFTLISLGVILTRFGAARQVMRPRLRQEVARAGLRLLPMFLFMAAALGLVVIGQTVSWLTRVGAINYLGTVMVVVVVRELGPLTAALLVLARTGTANVVELGTARALGEVEALEALGIDPVHYLIVPRILGMALGVFALTVYLILGALVSGYLWAFIQDVPLRPTQYIQQLVSALTGLDFILLAVKAFTFGFIIALVTCYHGLAQPLRLEQVSRATVAAVAQCVIACVLLDALFIVAYLIT
jgi:phospholipid/cholesterol/gamma-HCH transport system permease protein